MTTVLTIVGVLLLIALAIGAFLVFPIMFDREYHEQHNRHILIVGTLILQSMGLVGMLFSHFSKDDGKEMTLAIIFTLVSYVLSFFFAWRKASNDGCSTGDCCKAIAANFLLPVCAPIAVILFVAYLIFTSKRD